MMDEANLGIRVYGIPIERGSPASLSHEGRGEIQCAAQLAIKRTLVFQGNIFPLSPRGRGMECENFQQLRCG
jgi:hypothetical protein